MPCEHVLINLQVIINSWAYYTFFTRPTEEAEEEEILEYQILEKKKLKKEKLEKKKLEKEASQLEKDEGIMKEHAQQNHILEFVSGLPRDSYQLREQESRNIKRDEPAPTEKADKEEKDKEKLFTYGRDEKYVENALWLLGVSEVIGEDLVEFGDMAGLPQLVLD